MTLDWDKMTKAQEKAYRKDKSLFYDPEGNPMPIPLGVIGILTTEHGRYSRFWNSFMGLAAPGPVHVITKFSLNIAEARNQIFGDLEKLKAQLESVSCKTIERGMGLDWVWYMDDDHTFHPLILRNLIARNVDIIQPLVLTRYQPFGPVIMGPTTPDGKKHWRFALLPNDPIDVKEVEVAGCAGMLIRRPVWEAIPQPIFEIGQISPEVLSEDVIFCRKAKEQGFRVWCDMQNIMGHLNVGEVLPKRKPDGSWVTVVRFGHAEVEIPAAQPKYKVQPDGRAVDTEGNEYVGD